MARELSPTLKSVAAQAEHVASGLAQPAVKYRSVGCGVGRVSLGRRRRRGRPKIVAVRSEYVWITQRLVCQRLGSEKQEDEAIHWV